MNNEFQEKIICNGCGAKLYRKLEIQDANMKDKDLLSPLKILIIKKFKCQQCNETENYKIEIIKNN
jgi:predicted nucleic-acid-binding Zn-ribbon protein